MDNQKLLIGLAVVVVVFVVYCWWCRGDNSDDKKKKKKRENFTYDQIALNAKNYTFIPSRNCQGCLPQARPDFTNMTCNASGVREGLEGMSKEQIQQEIDLHYRKPMEMVDTKDLLPDTDISGLSFGVDPSEDYANKFVWHRTTFARLKRRNWETGAAMIRGDLIIDPGKQSWFQHDNDYRDLTPGFIPKQYCGQIDVEDLSYNMHKIH
jgi:hypothetical protein